MSSKKIFLFAALIIILAAALRLYYAYICSLYIYCDAAIMGTVARQILKGEQYRLFFYGNYYLWTIESWIIALFFLIFGISNFTLYLGPIFLSALFLIFTFFLGREFKSREVGFYALVYAAFCPFYFFNHSVIPQGYHILLPLIGTVILLLTLVIVRTRGFRGFLYFIIIGLLSGVSFWLHFITLYYLAAAGIYLFFSMIASRRFKYYLLGGIFSFISFFIGGLPCWIYCLKNDFICFSIPRTGTFHSVLPGVKRFISYQVPGILGNNLFTIAIFALAMVFLAVSIRPTKNKTINKNWLFVLLFISMAVLFSQGGGFTGSGDHRYILPIYSLVPVAIACFVSWINRKLKYLGTGILVVLVLVNIFKIRSGLIRDKHNFSEIGGKYNQLVEYFRAHGISGVYGSLRDVSTINYLGKDKIFGVKILDSANPFNDEVVGSCKIAYLGGECFGPVFSMLCRSYKKDEAGGFSFVYGFEPWGYYGEEILPDRWKGSANYNSAKAGCAFDRNLDEFWSTEEVKKTGMYFQVEFPQVYTIYKFQVVNMPGKDRNLPCGYRIWVSLDGKNWKTVQEQDRVEPMFWSGPGVLWRFRDTRWEVIFPPVEARFVRIENTVDANVGYPWEINEIIFYKYLGEKEYGYRDYVYDARKVWEFIKNEGIKSVYTDYWLSEKIRSWSGNNIKTLRVKSGCWRNEPYTSRLLALSEDAAIIVSKENERAVEKILAELKIKFKKVKIRNYVCLYSFSANNNYPLEDLKSLYWIGPGIAKINLRGLGELLAAKFPEAVKYYSGNTEIYNRVAEFYRQSGMKKQYEKIKRILRHKFMPEFSFSVEFRGGIEFFGWSIDRHELNRGGLFKIDYFWKIKKKYIDGIFVFVHFSKGRKIIFQNDHLLLEDYIKPHVELPGGVWKESYIVKVPPDAETGEYTIKLGLYYAHGGQRRLRILSSRSTAVEIGEIIVE